MGPVPPGDAKVEEPRNWHETFGVSAAALETVAAQIAANYPTEREGAVSQAVNTPQLGNSAEPSAKRARLADGRELHRSRDGCS